MDEHDAIPRREALAGLSLLAALMLALVGTVAIRIVRSAPEVLHGPAAPPTWASQAGAKAAVESDLQDVWDQPDTESTSDAVVAVDLPPATPIPTAAVETSSVPATSETPALPPSTETPQQQPAARPVFVAPAGR